MESLIPKDAIELTAIAAFCISALLIIATRKADSRAHYVRILAMFLVTGLALIAAHWTTYFAAVFVVATAVTDTEFLQTIAAIIRGDKNYFSYKIELVGASQREHETSNSTSPPALVETRESRPADSQQIKLREAYPGLVAEQLAILDLERLLQTPITRNVRISEGTDSLEVDGLVQSRRGATDRIVEVKYSASSGHLAALVRQSPDQIRSIIERYRRITKRPCVLDYIIVVAAPQLTNEPAIAELRERLKGMDGVTLHVRDYQSLNRTVVG